MGFIGAVHVEALHRLKDVDVVAVADVSDAAKKAKALGVPRGYGDYREMIERENLDVLHICTPNDTHFDAARYALESGVHILCEKPMTRTVEEAEELCLLAQKRGLLGAMNFAFRYYPMVMQMHDMVCSGEVGRIFTIHGSYLQDWLFYDNDYTWRLDPLVSGESRAFADIGSHWIDMVEWITGQRVVAVMADFSTVHPIRRKPLGNVESFANKLVTNQQYEDIHIETEDCAAVLFRFANGSIGSCIISQVYGGRKNQTIISVGGSECAMHWDSEEVNSLWIGRRNEANLSLVRDPALLKENARSIVAYPGGHAEGFADAIKQNFAAFYYDIIKGEAVNPLYATLEDGLREMRICENVILSAREKRWIAF